MTIGPGKYDDLAVYVREQTDANAVIVMVFEGNKGNGFSVIADLRMTHLLPDMLEQMAKQLRKDGEQMMKGNA